MAASYPYFSSSACGRGWRYRHSHRNTVHASKEMPAFTILSRSQLPCVSPGNEGITTFTASINARYGRNNTWNKQRDACFSCSSSGNNAWNKHKVMCLFLGCFHACNNLETRSISFFISFCARSKSTMLVSRLFPEEPHKKQASLCLFQVLFRP